jgi:hypothetical protein
MSAIHGRLFDLRCFGTCLPSFLFSLKFMEVWKIKMIAHIFWVGRCPWLGQKVSRLKRPVGRQTFHWVQLK